MKSRPSRPGLWDLQVRVPSPLACLLLAVLATPWLTSACGSSVASSSVPLEAAKELPEPVGWVSDLAELLSPSERTELELFLCQFEARTGNEFAVLTVPSTGPEKIEEFSLRVARDWGMGKPGLDNGLLILVARDDRLARIEVGTGLSQGPIPDSVALEVMKCDMVPAFAEGRWADGLHAGLQALFAAAEQP